jgi:hypothetical protein
MPSPSSTVGLRRRGHGYLGGPVGPAGPAGPTAGVHTRYWPSEDRSRPPRASLALLPGRGESIEPFERLAFRLALDGYAVTYFAPGADTPAALGEIRLPGIPLVLLGSDTGALRALTAAGSPAVRPDAVVLLGLPLLHLVVAGQRLDTYPPRSLPDLPILLVHGAGDPVSPLSLIRMTTRTAPRCRLDVVPGGHQILGGPSGWSVPARILLFVDGLTGPGTGPGTDPGTGPGAVQPAAVPPLSGSLPGSFPGSLPGRQRPPAPECHVHDDPRADEVQTGDRDPQLSGIARPGLDRQAQRA